MGLRFADAADVAAITSLINQAFRVEQHFKAGDRLDAEEVRELMQAGRFLLLEENGQIQGCVYLELRGDRAYLGLLSTSPKRQKSGIGTRLTTAAEEFARESGSKWMDLRVVSLREELPPIYEKFGYAISGREEIPEGMLQNFTKTCYFIRMSKELGHRK